MKVFVYSPDIRSIDPFQIALRRDGLSTTEARQFVEQMHFRSLQPVGMGWKSPPMVLRWDGREEGRPIEACDFPVPYDSGAIVMSDRAKNFLASFIESYGELLPLDCDGGIFWILNVTCIIDAIDADHSEWLPVPGEQPKLWREAFVERKIADAAFFRLPAASKKSRTYFTQRFLDEVARYGLTGFHGRELWDSEKGIVT